MHADELTRLRRHPERGDHDPAAIAAILDQAPFCHLAVVVDGQPLCIPTIHARLGQHLYLHGSSASRLMRALAAGTDVCLTVTVLDGVVLARAAFYHSMNYRSAMVFGRSEPVDDHGEKLAGMTAMIDRLAPGRWPLLRAPTTQELAATQVARVPLARASAKVRVGPPKDRGEDAAWPVWAGEVPLHLASGTPRPDGETPSGAVGPELGAFSRA
jgi:nitroimidazol reductase NimA-like FMN-containing flavoprotein (pyridoxamine 5'-phosphate oxidase superfamily)